MPDRVARRIWDVAIVGAGPAGETAAMLLAGRGHTVALIDRYDFPRDKTCGDGLIPDTLRCLERLSLYDRVRSHALASSAITVYSPARVAVDLPGDFVTVRRRTFDDLLVREACTRGAALVRGHVTGVESAAADEPTAVRISDRSTSAPKRVIRLGITHVGRQPFPAVADRGQYRRVWAFTAGNRTRPYDDRSSWRNGSKGVIGCSRGSEAGGFAKEEVCAPRVAEAYCAFLF